MLVEVVVVALVFVVEISASTISHFHSDRQSSVVEEGSGSLNSKRPQSRPRRLDEYGLDQLLHVELVLTLEGSDVVGHYRFPRDPKKLDGESFLGGGSGPC